ncbi:hypothetical protein [Novosphingobium terrae]|uniref:hypothetical protein n=1 Tax=Novosphingobium terrae TaxID=2726189 RepID=UPI00197F6B12|nr:hypothetical protein [Novosphingobium terrae]
MLLAIIAVSALSAASFAGDKLLWGGRITDTLGAETYKLLLQFMLITLIGGGVFAYVTARREEHSKRESRLAAVQALDKELGDAYRAVKRVKRKMRSRLQRTPDGPPRMDASTFTSIMDELLDVQIALEEVRGHVTIRGDLLSANVVERLGLSLRYASRYLHDVFEDFERGRIRKEGEVYLIDASSTNIEGFLIDSQISTDVKRFLSYLRSEDLGSDEKIDALKNIDALREAVPSQNIRYGEVAMECLRFASSEIHQVIGKSY